MARKNRTPEEKARLIAEDPAYGRVVCRCETISEGEIVDAIRRPLGAKTLDGVKRIVAAEDQLRAGAVGERLSALLLEQGAGTEKLVLRSVGTTLPSQGSTVELLHALGLDAEGIAQAVREVLA